MPLYVRDDEIAALTNEIQKITKAKTKTEVLRKALQHELMLVRKSMPPKNRFAKVHALADTIGEPNSDFNMKTYTDEMWGK